MTADRSNEEAISFAESILPLFVSSDFACMADFGVMLDDHAYMADPAGDAVYPDHANIRHILGRLDGTGGRRMPPGRPWPEENIQLVRQWLVGGCQP